jgi:sugar O-acyltransferase (sialic acid O-acetyltransferase NeuD family)
MTDLLLVAASGLAREVADAVRAGDRYRLAGVLDDDPARWGTTCGGVPVLGGLREAVNHPDAALVVCAGAGSARSALVARLSALGIDALRYGTVVHPRASVSASSRVGSGSIALAGVALTADATVGHHCVLMPNAVLTHDTDVRDFVTVCAGVTVAGNVHVGMGAYLGASASVRQHVRIGAWSTLGMGAVALSDIPPGEVWAGTPAHCLSRTAQPALSTAH